MHDNSISLFALMHDNSNIFYINATNVGYRVLEFNLGVCAYSSMNAESIQQGVGWKNKALDS